MENRADRTLVKRQLSWAVALLVGVAALWSAWWYLSAQQALDATQAWAADQIQSGYRINWQQIDASGYPFSLKIGVQRPVVEKLEAWRWSTEFVQAHISLWNWSEIKIDGAPKHQLFLSRGAKLHTYELSSAFLEATVNMDGSNFTSLDIHTTVLDLKEGDRLIGGIDSAQIILEIPLVMGGGDIAMVGAIEARVQGLQIPGLSTTFLGPDISRLSFRTELFGEPPQDITPGALAVWRDLGGVIEIRHLSMDYGVLRLQTEGTMALDGSLQPVGSLTAKVEGYAEILNAMKASGMISGGEALGARIVLGALSKDDPATGIPGISIPLMIQQQTLHAGPVALIKIPTIKW